MTKTLRTIITCCMIVLFGGSLFGQENSLQIANGFMNDIKTFLIEEGFSPKIEDGYINFKKEGLGFHLQVTGTGPYIYQFYVDGVQMPEGMDLSSLLIDINNASATGALIRSVYQGENEPLTVLIRIAGATRSTEDFKYVFYTYLTGLQYGYNQALTYAQNPGINYPYPKSMFEHQALKVTNVYIGNGMTVVDFIYDNTEDKDTQIWMQDSAYLTSKDNNQSYNMIKAEGISTDRMSMTKVGKKSKLPFRLYFQELPPNTTKIDFFEGSTTGLGTPFSVWGIELKK